MEKVNYEELHNVYSAPNVIRVIKLRRRRRWAENVVHMEEIKRAYKIVVGRPERKRLFGRPRCRWKVNIKLDLKK
jgi:hypothetical protein